MKYKLHIVAVISLVILLAGCFGSSEKSTTWLLVIGTDTITVGQTGESWNRITDQQRNLFISKDNPVGEYIVAYGRRIILEMELEAEGYLSDPLLMSFKESWLKHEISSFSRNMIFEKEKDGVTDYDIRFYMDHLGESVWFTINPDSENEMFYGPDHLPELPIELATLLDTLSIHEIGIDETGMQVRLDSISLADSALIAQTMTDSAVVSNMAVLAIASGRFTKRINDTREYIIEDSSLSVDSSAIEELAKYYLGIADPFPEYMIVESSFRDWTAQDLINEINFLDTRIRINPWSPDWLESIVEMLLENEYYFEIMRNEAPEILDSLLEEVEIYALDYASDQFYYDRIESAITITQRDLEEQYLNFDEPVRVQEMRVLQAVFIPGDLVQELRQVFLEENLDLLIPEMSGFENLAADTVHPQITRPLQINEIPGRYGNDVFLIDPYDTTSWLGPLDLGTNGDMVLFRLIEVIPERNATLDEVRPDLEVMVRRRLEEQATIHLMQELEEKYGLVINEKILNDLPPDPGVWPTL